MRAQVEPFQEVVWRPSHGRGFLGDPQFFALFQQREERGGSRAVGLMYHEGCSVCPLVPLHTVAKTVSLHHCLGPGRMHSHACFHWPESRPGSSPKCHQQYPQACWGHGEGVVLTSFSWVGRLLTCASLPSNFCLGLPLSPLRRVRLTFQVEGTIPRRV